MVAGRPPSNWTWPKEKPSALVDVQFEYVKVKHMSGRKLGNAEDFQPVTVQSKATRLDLTSDAIRICCNGIEFRSPTPFPVWSEMTVALQTPVESKSLNCTGVVVECRGDRHEGYRVSIAFTDLSRQAQARLTSLAYSH